MITVMVLHISVVYKIVLIVGFSSNSLDADTLMAKLNVLTLQSSLHPSVEE